MNDPFGVYVRHSMKYLPWSTWDIPELKTRGLVIDQVLEAAVAEGGDYEQLLHVLSDVVAKTLDDVFMLQLSQYRYLFRYQPPYL